MDELTVRRLWADDWETERDLRLAALADAPYAFGSTLADALLFTEADWRGRLRRQARFMAWLNGMPVGMAGFAVGFEPFPADAAILVGVWVAPAARGHGVGDALIDAATRAVPRGTGLGRVILCVLEDNAAAVRLYRRHGFQKVDLSIMPDPGEIHMELTVGQPTRT